MSDEYFRKRLKLTTEETKMTQKNLETFTMKIDGNDVEFVRRDSIQQFNPADYEALEPVIGKTYVIETPTKYWVGTLARITDSDYILVDAAFIGSTGRFHEFLAGKAPNELEPFPPGVPVEVSKGAKTVMYPLPKLQMVVI